MPLTRGCATRCCRCFPRSTSSERAGSACGSRACPPSLIVTGSSTPSARRSTHGRRRTRTCASSTSPTCARTHGARQPRLRRRCRQGRPINPKRRQPRRRGRRRRQPRLVHRRNFRFVARRALQAPCALLHRGRRLTRRPVGGNSAYRAPRPARARAMTMRRSAASRASTRRSSSPASTPRLPDQMGCGPSIGWTRRAQRARRSCSSPRTTLRWWRRWTTLRVPGSTVTCEPASGSAASHPQAQPRDAKSTARPCSSM